MVRKIFLVIALVTAVCFAQEKKNTPADTDAADQSNYIFFDYIKKLTVDDYNSLLNTLKKEDTTDFFFLRMAYTKTPDYFPYSNIDDESINNCQKYLDAKDLKGSLKPLDSILQRNYVNIKAHMYLGYIYKKLNNIEKSDYHYRVYDGLISSILETGNGKDPRNAYIVINVQEEYLLLDRLELQKTKQSLIESDGHKFDLMKVKEEKGKKEFEIYFNIDLPEATFGNK